MPQKASESGSYTSFREAWWQDLRGAYFGLRRSPAFACVVVATLALGIGATSALFAVVDTALLRPLPGKAPERLVWLQEYHNREESGGNPQRFSDWQRAHSFSAMCGLYSDRAIFETGHGPTRLRILHTLGDPNQTLGLPLLLGRGFTASENRGAGQPVAVLTAVAWRRYLSADPKVLKRTLRLGAAEYQIVGVLDSDVARGVEFPEDVDVWTPLSNDVARAPRQSGFLGQIARLAPGVSIASARAEVNLIGSQLATTYPATDKDRSATLVPLQDFITHEARRPLLLLLSAAAAVLLVACVNISGLLIARGLARQREAAIRISVGAGFLRLAMLFFAESVLLAGAGCALGLAVAYFGIGILKTALPPDIPHLAAVSLDWRAAACSAAVAACSALLFGLIPAWQFASRAQAGVLKLGSKGASGGHGRLRSALVVMEIALSLVLLVGAGLLAGSYFRMRGQAAGFSATNAYSFEVPFGWDTDPSTLNTFAGTALSRLTTSPGVVAAGVVDQLPLHGGSQSGALLVQGVDLDPALAVKQFSWRTASAGYFSAAGVPLRDGSLYQDWVGGKGNREALITDRLASMLFPNGDAVGHSIAEVPGGKDTLKGPRWFRIVGVVGSVRLNPTDISTEAGVYVPWGATYWPGMNFVVKSTRSVADFSRLVRSHVQTLTNDEMAENINSLEALTSETSASERVRTIILASFAGAALALSAIGLFGTLSHEVSRRTLDYGVRLALGAEPANIAWLAVRSALAMSVCGVFIGIGASFWTSQFLRGLLFGIEPFDFTAYAFAAFVLLLTAVAAALIPAIKAARIDPIYALRHE